MTDDMKSTYLRWLLNPTPSTLKEMERAVLDVRYGGRLVYKDLLETLKGSRKEIIIKYSAMIEDDTYTTGWNAGYSEGERDGERSERNRCYGYHYVPSWMG